MKGDVIPIDAITWKPGLRSVGNGVEFAAENVMQWLRGCLVDPAFTAPGSPCQNGFNVVETSVLGTRGVLRGGGSVALNGSVNLVNPGDLVAGNNITITLPGSFVNQETYQPSSFTTRPGCFPIATCR